MSPNFPTISQSTCTICKTKMILRTRGRGVMWQVYQYICTFLPFYVAIGHVYFHVYCPAFSNICQHKVRTKKLEGGGEGREGGAHLFIHFDERDPRGTYERKVVVPSTSIDLVIFEKAYYYPPVTDSCHGFGITCTYESKPSLLLIRKPNSSHAFFFPSSSSSIISIGWLRVIGP